MSFQTVGQGSETCTEPSSLAKLEESRVQSTGRTRWIEFVRLEVHTKVGQMCVSIWAYVREYMFETKGRYHRKK